MNRVHYGWNLILAVAVVVALAPAVQADDDVPYTEEFFTDSCKLAHRGSNDYFLRLKPGCWLLLEGEEEDDEGEIEVVTVLIEVLPGSRKVDGVRCAIVRESEWINDELVEVSWNYFAICKKHGDVFYFGEEVDIYEDGEVVSHDGAWLAGVDGAKAGVIMPGFPLIGTRYYQEIAPGVAQDRAEHLDNDATIDTLAGTFEHCLYTVETTPINPEEESFKAYAPGIGLVLDSVITLVDYGCGGDDDSDDDDSDDSGDSHERRRR